MAVKDFALGGGVLVSEKASPKFVLLERIIDFGVSANSVVSGDTVQCLNVPAGFYALGAGVEVLTIEATTSAQATRIELGDAADSNGFLTTSLCDLSTIATNLSGQGFSVTPEATVTWQNAYGAQGGKFYSVADTIDLFPKGTLNLAKVRVGVWGFMFDSGVGTAFGLDGDSA
jgi:hypothetical protein